MTIGASGSEPGSITPASEDAARRDRVRLLYQLPLARAAARVLMVGEGAAELARDWPGEVSICPVDRIVEVLREPAPSGFDTVAVPNLSDMAGMSRTPLLAALTRRLAPGGVLAGCARRSWGARHGWAAAEVSDLVSTLEDAGLIEVECYLVAPSIDDPMALIPAAPAAAKAHFRRQLDCARPHFSVPGYAMRRWAIACGWGGRRLVTSLFWARRPC